MLYIWKHAQPKNSIFLKVKFLHSHTLGNIPSVEGQQAVNHKINVLYCCDEPALWSQSVGTVTQHRPHGFVMVMQWYKYKPLHLQQPHNSLCHNRKASCSSTDMAPHSATLASFDHLHFSDKEKIKVCSLSKHYSRISTKFDCLFWFNLFQPTLTWKK